MKQKEEIRKKIIEKFRTVARTRLEKLNNSIVLLENDRDNEALGEELMREIHTLKGESKMVGFSDVNLIAHKVEDLLVQAKNKGFDFGDGIGDMVLRGLDIISILIHKRSGTEEGTIELEEFHESATLLLNQKTKSATRPTPKQPSQIPPSEDTRIRAEMLRTRMANETYLHIHTDKILDMSNLVGDMLMNRSQLSSQLSDVMSFMTDDVFADSGLTRKTRDRLQKKMAGLLGGFSKIDGEINSLDEKVRALRLVPVRQLFSSYPRVVRDLAKEQDKEASVKFDGVDIEIDKQVLDRIADPIVHILRNAIDHGIEAPEKRLACGKQRAGTITFSAEQQGAKVCIEIADDGRGIDPEAVAKKAVSKGIVKEAEALKLTEKEKRELLFYPGFSTRDEVSQMSGRGVGLDACRSIMESLNGSIEILSQHQKGTRFRLTAPVALAMVKLLLVEDIERTYAFPSLFIDKVTSEDEKREISVGGVKGIQIDSEMIPMINLSEITGIGIDSEGTKKYSLVLKNQNRSLAVNVDRIIGESEMILQPFDPFLRGLNVFNATVTTGDTVLVPVFSPVAIFNAATNRRKGIVSREIQPVDRESREKTILVVDDSDITRDLIVEIVMAMGYHVMDAGNGEEALQKLESQRADLILSDIEMPQMDGLQLLTQVRKRRDSKDTPFVVLSTRGSEDDKRIAMEKGADSYIVKHDFHEDLLYETVSRYLGSTYK